jgi:hypothetical protein
MPSLASVHDLNVIVWALEALSRGVCDEPALLDHLRQKIEIRQNKWGLTERDPQYNRLVEMVLQELEAFGLYSRAERTLTAEGNDLLARINAEKSRTPIIEFFLPRHLTQFEDVEAFLRFLDERGEVRIPRVPGKKELGLEVGHRGKSIREVETPETLKTYVEATFEKIRDHLPDQQAYWKSAETWQLNSRGKRHYDVVRTIVRDAALVGFKYGAVKYRLVRERLWYLGLINWSEDLKEFDGEVCYPLYRKEGGGLPAAAAFDSLLGKLYLYVPGLADIPFPGFVQALWTTFQKLSRETVGYVTIPDLRDATCRVLRLSDYGFNELFRRFAEKCSRNQQPFTCNWETAALGEITQKRLPIEVPGLGIRKAVSIHKL